MPRQRGRVRPTAWHCMAALQRAAGKHLNEMFPAARTDSRVPLPAARRHNPTYWHAAHGVRKDSAVPSACRWWGRSLACRRAGVRRSLSGMSGVCRRFDRGMGIPAKNKWREVGPWLDRKPGWRSNLKTDGVMRAPARRFDRAWPHAAHATAVAWRCAAGREIAK